MAFCMFSIGAKEPHPVAARRAAATIFVGASDSYRRKQIREPVRALQQAVALKRVRAATGRA